MKASSRPFSSSTKSIRSDSSSQSMAEIFAARAERALKHDREESLSPVPPKGNRSCVAGGGMPGSSSLCGNDEEVPFVGRDQELAVLSEGIDSILRKQANHSSIASLDNSQEAVNGQITSPNSTGPRVISIVGAAGSGKSRLAGELRTRVLERDGYFARGKCESCQHQMPYQEQAVQSNSNSTLYAGLANAMKDLTDQIMARDFDMGIRRRLREAVGPHDALVLVEIFPSLENVLEFESDESSDKLTDPLSPQKTLPAGRQDSVSKAQEQRAIRRRFLFSKFMRVLLLSSIDYCDEDIEPGEQKPQNEETGAFVLVIDDVQWIDLPSLDLLSGLVQDQELTNFLLVATVRPFLEEGDDTRPFAKESKLWRNQQIPIQSIHLQNLDIFSINTMVATVLDTEPKLTADLAETVHQKTGGNAFFALEFVKTLVDQNLLTYSYGTLNWKWDTTKVQSLVLHENGAVGLLVDKMNRLPTNQQLMLIVAACLGGTFEKELMASLMENVSSKEVMKGGKQMSKADVEATLASLLESTLLGHHQELYFISHDLIKEAALDLIHKDKIALLKVHLGEHILNDMIESPQQLTANNKGSLLFLGVGLCNSYGMPVPREIRTLKPAVLAEYNLQAGEKAMQESAFVCAKQYMEQGISLLEADGEEAKVGTNSNDHYDRLLAGLVEANYCTGNAEDLSASANRVLQRTCSRQLELQMLFFLILSSNAQEEYEQSVNYGFEALKLLNVATFPKKPGMFHVAMELIKTQRKMQKHTKESLLVLPVLLDENRVNAQKFFDILQDASFVCNPNFFLVTQLKSVRWAVKYGVSEYTPSAFALYGAILQRLFNDAQRGIMFGEAALELADLLGVKQTIARTTMIAMECGDTVGAFTACWYMDTYSWISARVPLQVLSRDLEKHYASCRIYKNTAVGDGLVFLGVELRKLCDAGDKAFMWLDCVDCGYADRAKKQRSATVEASRNFILLESHFLLGDMAEALGYAKKLQDVAKIAMGLATVPRTQYYRGLVLLHFAGEGQDPGRNLREAKSIVAMMKKWIEDGHVNCIQMGVLLEAELARIGKQRDAARKLYTDAIRMATRMQYSHDVGICNQYAAVFFLQNEDRTRAAYHIQQAINGFVDWGAMKLVRRLREQYSDLLRDTGIAGYQSSAFAVPAE